MADPAETSHVSETSAELETTELLEAVRSLAEQVGNLQAELQALRASAMPLPREETGVHGWEDRVHTGHESPPWMRSLDSPASRRPPVPRLLLEVLFLAAVAVLAALAELDAPVIVALMAGAWALVAAAEWAVAREEARREEALSESAFGARILAEDPTWFSPPAEPGLLEDVGDDRDREDMAAKLPPPLDE